ncbi:MAG TPA: flagellar basal body P-ring formation chaperone FlgA [Kiloniellales bacterium]|jgi:flagella basal body P-ring formation protein FlgA
MRRLLLILALLLAAPAVQATGTATAVPVLVKPHVIVDGPMVLLGDLFDGAGDQAVTAIARSPEPGKRVEVGARWLAAVAKAYGLAWRPNSRYDRVVVERASQVIDTRRIETELTDALAARGATGRTSLLLDQPGLRLDLPTDVAPTLAISGLNYDPASGRFTAILVAPASGTPLANATISGRVVTMTEVPVLRRRVEPGEVIRADDVEWSSVRTDRIGRDIIVDTANLIGMSPRRPVRPGDTILASELQAPVVVAKNSLVTIRLDTNRMSLSAQGRALEPGSNGDVIRVMNTKSNKIINAAVVDSGTVRVVTTTVSSAN